MKNLLLAILVILPLVGCSASIGTPTTTRTVYTSPDSTTTVTKTTNY